MSVLLQQPLVGAVAAGAPAQHRFIPVLQQPLVGAVAAGAVPARAAPGDAVLLATGKEIARKPWESDHEIYGTRKQLKGTSTKALTLADLQARYPRLEITREIKGLNQAALRDLFFYEDGCLIPRADQPPHFKAGRAIGGTGGKAQRRFWKHVLLSRWIWLYHRGWIPVGKKYVIDHIDNNPLNDRIENLQLLHFVENMNKDQAPHRPSIFNMTREQRIACSRRGHETQKRRGTGMYDPAVRAKSRTPEARAKAVATRLARHGFQSPFADPVIQAKAQATRQARGIKSPFADPAIRAKAQATRNAKRRAPP